LPAYSSVYRQNIVPKWAHKTPVSGLETGVLLSGGTRFEKYLPNAVLLAVKSKYLIALSVRPKMMWYTCLKASF
jgi:hypothetical protein